MFNLALYGAGNRTKALINALLFDNFYKIHAVYDLNPAASKALGEEYNCKVCGSPEELLASGADAFLISLSPFAHAQALRETIPLGKPIFVEKPVSFSSKEILELKLLAEKYNTPVQVGFMRRYLPATLGALDYMAKNDGGRLINIDCYWFHHGDTEMNFNLEKQPDNFRLKVSQVPFHCCHMLDIMLLTGGPVKSVNSQLIKWTERPYPSPDDLIANIEFANGANGRFHYSSMVYCTEFAYRYYFENYSVKLTAGKHQLEVYHRPRYKTSEIGPDQKKCKDFTGFNYAYEVACKPEETDFNNTLEAANENIMYDFVKTVRDGMVPKADLNAALRVQGFSEAMEEGGKARKIVYMDELGMPIRDENGKV